MSEELHQWLADRCESQAEAAIGLGQALVALASAGPALGPPTVVKAAPGGQDADLREALDATYQSRLEHTQSLRHATAEAASLDAHFQARMAELETSGAPSDAAEAAELRELLPGVQQAAQRLVAASQRAQADTEAFRVRKETLKARYTAQEAQDAIAELLDDPAIGLHDADGGGSTRLAEIAAEIEGELAREATASDLLELLPEAPGDPAGDISIVFAIEPADTALLISVLEGQDAIADRHADALALSAGILRRVRAGQDPEAAAVGYPSAEPFLAEFFAANSAEIQAGADAIALRSGHRSLAGLRTRLGLTVAQVAGRMDIGADRVSALERADLDATEVGDLASYIDALGGQLLVTADVAGEQSRLR